MEFMTAKEASEAWGISARRVATLCEQGRINGVKKAGKTWLLPPDAVKPTDQRCKENRKKKDNNNMSNYTEYQSRFFCGTIDNKASE